MTYVTPGELSWHVAGTIGGPELVELSLHAAILDLIAQRREGLGALARPDPDLEAALEDLEVGFLDLVDKSTPAEQETIGEFCREALEAFGSNEELFH